MGIAWTSHRRRYRGWRPAAYPDPAVGAILLAIRARYSGTPMAGATFAGSIGPTGLAGGVPQPAFSDALSGATMDRCGGSTRSP